MVTTAGEELADQQRARGAVDDAHHAMDQVHKALHSRPMRPGELREAVAATVAVVEALSTVVGHLMLHAPVALAGHDGMVGEVVADLRALRGCLITGARLAEPALDGLRALPAPDAGGPADVGRHAAEHGQPRADRSTSAPA